MTTPEMPPEPTNDEIARAPRPLRIGDAERDAATERLRDHLVAGRLEQWEFDERLQRTLGARTQDELDTIFADLPAEGAGLATAPAAPPVPVDDRGGRAARFYGVASSVAFPLAIAACFVFGWRFWWLIPVVMFVVPAIGQAMGVNDRRGRRGAED